MDDIFRTQSNVYNDTFSNPVNAANMNPGWGMNPALMTPSFDAPYRPQYMGPTGYAAYGKPGFFRGGANILGPSTDPYWGNPIDNSKSSSDSVATRPFDAAAWGIQNIAIPYAGYSGMAKILGPSTSGLWEGFKATARGEGIAGGLGYGMGSGFAGAFTKHAGTRAAMGMAGGAMAGLALPLLAGQAVSETLDATIVSPYLNSRQNAQMLQANFSNIYLGAGIGGPVSGKGLSGAASHRMGTEIMHQGLNDMMFSRSEYSDIGDMSARAGLLDNAKSSQITQRIKDVAEQVKLIVALTNDPDIRTAIESLSKLNLAGADVSGGRFSQAGRTMSTIAGYAAAGGTSVQKMMNTVGAQGQYLYQSNGMTPYLGQLAAANSYAGFAGAQRLGLLSPQQMARMGGVDGAAQSAMTAQVIGAQSPFAMMGAYNAYVSGHSGTGAIGANQTATGTLAEFGRSVSQDPIAAMGKMALYGQAAAGAGITNQGSKSLENLAVGYLKSQGVRPSADGMYDSAHIAAALQALDVPKDAITAYISKRSSEQTTALRDQQIEGFVGTSREQTRQFISQNNLGGGIIDSTMRATSRLAHSVGTSVAEETINPFTHSVGKAADSVAEFADYWGFGRSTKDGWRVKDADRAFGAGNSIDSKVDVFDVDLYEASSGIRNPLANDNSRWFLDKVSQSRMKQKNSSNLTRKINELHKGGDADAAAFINAANDSDREKALEKILKKHKGSLGREAGLLSDDSDIPGMDGNQVASNRKTFLSDVSAMSKVSETLTNDAKADVYRRSYASANDQSWYSKMTGTETTQAGYQNNLGNLYLVGAATSLQKKLQSGEITRSEARELLKDPKYSSLVSAAGGDLDKAISMSETIFKRGAVNDTLSIGMDVFSTEGLTPKSISEMSAASQDKATAGYLNKRGGIGGVGSINNAMNMDPKDVMNQFLTSDAQTGSVKQQIDAYTKTGANFTDYVDTLHKLDKIDQFGAHIDKFGKAVSEMNRTPIVSDAKDYWSKLRSTPAGDGIINGETKTQVPNKQ